MLSHTDKQVAAENERNSSSPGNLSTCAIQQIYLIVAVVK